MTPHYLHATYILWTTIKKFHKANKLLISIVDDDNAREDENFHKINFIVYCSQKKEGTREEKLKKCETHHKMWPFI